MSRPLVIQNDTSGQLEFGKQWEFFQRRERGARVQAATLTASAESVDHEVISLALFTASGQLGAKHDYAERVYDH